MKYYMMMIVSVVILSVAGNAQSLPSAPVSHAITDGSTFHRANDFMYGSVITGIGVAIAPKHPWIGLVAGIGAGVANEARYGKNFNTGHLAVISAGSFASYGICKLIQHESNKHHKQDRTQVWIGN